MTDAPFDHAHPEDWCRPGGPDRPSRLPPGDETPFCAWARTTHPDRAWPVADPNRLGQGWAAYALWSLGRRRRGEA